MAIPEGHRKNFETMLRAAKNGNLALLECADMKTDKPVYTVVMVNRRRGGDVEFVPVAKLFDGNPYEELTPPIEEDDDQRRTAA